MPCRATQPLMTESQRSWNKHLDRVVDEVQDEVFAPLSAGQRRTLAQLLGRLS
jgi:hypothetical protein